MRILFFYSLLIAVVLIAWWRGRTEERWGAAICVLGTVCTNLAISPLHQRYAEVETTIMVTDIAVFAAFLILALRTDRYWPIWAAGLQLTATAPHLFKYIAPDLLSLVYGAALAFWSYPILLVVAAGALRSPQVDRWRVEAIRLPQET